MKVAVEFITVLCILQMVCTVQGICLYCKMFLCCTPAVRACPHWPFFAVQAKASQLPVVNKYA